MTAPVLEQLRLRAVAREPGMPSRAVLAVAAAVAMAAAFPPANQWWAAPVSVGLLALATKGVRLAQAAMLGTAAGAVFFASSLAWLRVIGWDAYLVTVLLCAGWWALLLTAQALLQRQSLWPLSVPLAWVVVEAGRGALPLGGFPWLRLAHSQVDGPLSPALSVVGAAGVTFLVALAGTAAAWGLLNAQRMRPRQFGVGAVAAASLALATTWAVGSAHGTAREGPTARVAVVQGGGSEVSEDGGARVRDVLGRHARLTMTLAPAGEQLDLVVWPESASDLDPFADAGAARVISAAARSVGAPILVGATIASAARPGRLENTALAWDPAEGPGDRYVKRNLVPFGEYVPFGDVLRPLIGRLAAVPRDFVPGPGPALLRAGDLRVASVLCFEVAFDSTVREAMQMPAQLLVVQSNNATYTGTAEPVQQLLISRARAIEHGVSVAVASTTGVSAFIAPDGSVVSMLDDGEAGTLTADVVLRTEQTAATRWGGWVESALVLAGLLAVALSASRVACQSHGGSTAKVARRLGDGLPRLLGGRGPGSRQPPHPHPGGFLDEPPHQPGDAQGSDEQDGNRGGVRKPAVEARGSEGGSPESEPDDVRHV